MPFDPSGVIPVAGALGAAALQQHYAVKNWKRANEYNLPKNQVQRLKDAKLPLAAMFGGSGGSTGGSIPTPNVDPTLGTAEGLRSTNMTRFQRKQMEIMDQELRAKTAEADLKEADRDFQLQRTIDSSDGKNIPDWQEQPGDSNLVIGLRRDRAIRNLEVQTKGIENQLKTIDLQMKPEQIRSAIDQVLSSTRINNQIIARDEKYFQMLDKVMDDMIKGGTGWEGLGRLIKTWFYKMALR